MKDIKRLALTINYEQPPQQDIQLAGFLFYCNGLLLQKQLVRKNMLEFDLSNYPHTDKEQPAQINPKELRLFIIPVTDKKFEKITSVDELASFKPYEAILNNNREGDFSILPIPDYIAKFWPLCNCRVTGKVSKWIYMDSWQDRPICRARVHICEIDPIRYWIDRIPDTVIAKIPELFLKPREVVRIPVPTPDPPPFMRSIEQLQPNIFKTESSEEVRLDALEKLPELGQDIKQNLASGNISLIKDTLINNYHILHPWFCLWPRWWHWFYRCTERKVVYTDANGRFDTNISYLCFGDKPDLYFWVEYLINGTWVSVYKPPIPCHTYWNYTCGSNIHIHITDPRVTVDCCCNCPLPGELVWVRSIGNTSVSHINQQNILQPPPGQSISYNRLGLTDAGAIGDGFFSTTVGDYKRPFGGTLSFYMGFGDSLPKTQIYYYRWRYKKVMDASLNPVAGSVENMNNLEQKTYDFTYIDSNGDEQVGYNSVKLGPFTVGANNDLYIIPPPNPAQAPFNAPENNPEWFERTRNTHTISINTAELKNGAADGGDGLYEFVLELFDQAGNLLNNLNKNIFKVPNYTDANISVNAPDELLVDANATTADGLKMLARIDNSACHSNIFTVNVNGLPAASDCCGFVKYKPGGIEADLELSFLATHPNDFAVLNFSVTKGTCGAIPLAAAGGMVIDSAGGYLLSGGIYSKHFTPQQLLDSCYHNGNGKAAFAETLSVIAIATDGTFRQSSKDAPYRVAAFALEP